MESISKFSGSVKFGGKSRKNKRRNKTANKRRSKCKMRGGWNFFTKKEEFTMNTQSAQKRQEFAEQMKKNTEINMKGG